MPSASKHLEKIMNNHNRFAYLQVVFVDIEKYSKRSKRQVNEEIKKRSDSGNYVELKKVLHTPIFVKAEFFGDVLHWSFFGYRIDGQLAPSFWCEERKTGDHKNRGIYQVLKEEFETIWENATLSDQINVLPDDQEAVSNPAGN